MNEGGPVSYTHLYYQEYGKNNVIEYRKLMEALSDEDKRLLIEQMDEFAKKYPQYAHPVSYTHLDVYKRQAYIAMIPVSLEAVRRRSVIKRLSGG